MNPFRPAMPGGCLGRLWMLCCTMISAGQLMAQPAIVSTVPANMATGVSLTAPVVFTFSEAMDPGMTSAQFMDAMTYQFLTTSAGWNGNHTVLTCTPAANWPVNQMIVWTVSGQNPAGTALGGDTAGMFTAATASIGCDTNASMLSFTLAKGWMYEQTSVAAPSANTNTPYCFLACMSLPCPRDASGVSLQWPAGGVVNMVLTTIPGHLTWTDCSQTSTNAFEATYPGGDYTFTVEAAASNQQVTVNFPSTLAQPPAPHLTNYAAAQSINASSPFVLAWDPWAGGTVADCIYVEIYGGVFQTANIGEKGMLNGTARSVVIPAGTLQPNRGYPGCISFYRYVLLTNGTSHVSLTYRSSTTEFDLNTTAGAASLVITNVGWTGAGKVFAFDVACPAGQSLVAEYSTNLAAGQWRTLCATNSATPCVQFSDPRAATNAHLFYRVRTGR